MNIHPQLLQDCYRLGRMSMGTLLLHKNASVYWFILVPGTDETELFALPKHVRDQIMDDCHTLSAEVRKWEGVEKLNFAAIGNIVPQLHLHLIGRNPSDPCWPGVVWGNLAETKMYTDQELDQIKRKLSPILVSGD